MMRKSWASFYLAVSVLGASLSLWRIWRDLGRPEWKIAWHEWRDGFHFALQTASYAAFGSTDKPVIARLVEPVHRRNLCRGQRLAMAAAIPVRSLLYSAYVRFFQARCCGSAEQRAAGRATLLPLGIGSARWARRDHW